MFHAIQFGRLVAAVSLFLMLLGCAALRHGPGIVEPDAVGPRKVIALVPDAQATADMRAAAVSDGYQVLDVTRLRGLELTMLTFRMPAGVTGPEAIAALEAAVPSATVGINHAYRLQQTARTAQTLDYANEMMRWRKNGCRARGPVGVIDTGIDTSAPALAGVKVITRSFFDGQAVPAAHGTDVAAVLANPDRLTGVMIYGANVFGQQDALGLKAGADSLVRALDWLAQEEVRFVNLALAGPYNKLLDLAVERAVARGLILVAAVGNEGPDVDPLYPAGFDGVIAVTAVDAERRIYRNAVRGPHVDIAAPGVDVLVPSGRSARFVTGTSIATPFVTARLVADPSLVAARSVADVRNRLSATSEELGPAGRDPMFGYGLALAEDICGE
ncbi:S8 family serine peptidase [Roseobacter weihaiensis]|uniref:S8 family serine peptidase n=1 Tax=Roseobacter weihaiensis TaxID=2763262 RepID=UPI001D09CD44|nr:S8 family serine peptidase [Roseobacter sp. H9]